MTLGSFQPLATATVAIVLGCLFWRYQWRLSNRRKAEPSKPAEEDIIPDPNPSDTNIDSELPAINDITDLNYPSSLEEYVEHDRRILSKYTWTSYKAVPPEFRKSVELTVLKDILAANCDVSLDACIACLKDNPSVRALLLQGWERGTFEALRSDEEFLAHGMPFKHGNGKQASQPSSGELEGEISSVGSSKTDTGGVILSPGQPHSEVTERTSGQCLVAQEAQDATYPALEENEDEDSEYEDSESLRNQDTSIDGIPAQYGDANLSISQSKFIAGRDVHVAVSVWKAIHTSGEDREIATWFFDVVDYRTIHNEIAEKRSKSTGGWLLQSKTYKEWCDSPQQGLMWCPGIPGVGKTVMASLIVDHLRTVDEEHTLVGFIYFNYKLRSQQSKTAIFGALCRQAYETHQNPEVKQYLMELYDSHKKRMSRPTDTELRSTLSRVFLHYSGCYIVIDALDEYTAEYSDKKVCEVISDILSLGSNVKLLITSRVLGNMETTFRELGASREDIEGDEGDMRAYLGERVAILKSNLDFEVSDDFSRHITDKVIEAAKGRFLVAELGMNLLAEQFNLGELEDALEKLPNEIDDTYVRVMELIKTYPEGRRKLAMNALKWVAYANRRLYVCELQHALATKHGRKDTKKYVTPLSTITSLCAGLIVVQDSEYSFRVNDNRIVHFVHFTTQEFFEKMQSKYFCNPHEEMFSTCIEYLSITGNYSLPAGFTWESIHYCDLKHYLPLYDYSTMNWGHHASTHHNSLHEEVQRFLLENSRALDLSWDYMLQMLSINNGSIRMNLGGSGIFLAAYHDQFNTLPQLCDQMHTFPCTRNGRTPLHIAALSGSRQTVKFLLEHKGVEVDTKDNGGQTPLSYAAQMGKELIVKLLLEHRGVEVDTKDNHGWTPLSYAAQNGREPIVKLLLEHRGVEVDTKDNDGQTPLSHAAAKGEESIVKLLLEHGGVEVNTKDNKGQTPLSYAAEYGNEPIVKLLLEHGGVEVDTKDDEGRAPLSYAAENGNGPIVKLLLEHGGVEVDTKDKYGQTPLSHAAENGRESIVKLLLEHRGVEVNAKDNWGWTPLSYAAENGHEPVVKLLLEHGGVEVNTKDCYYGQTPLSYAAENGGEPIVRLLLEHGGVEVDSKDSKGRTPLSYAAENGRESIVKFLLEHGGVEVNTKDNYGRTPLSYAAGGRPFLVSNAVIRLLLKHGGVEVNTKHHLGRSPFSYAAKNGNVSIAKLLLERGGVDVDAKDDEGQTPLSYAAKYGNKPTVKLLLEHGGVEVNTVDSKGHTPLSYARQRFHNESVVKLLLEHGGVDGEPVITRE